MYLQSFLKYHRLNELDAARTGVAPIKYISFRQYFEDHAYVYEYSNSSHIDYEFEYLTDSVWTIAGKEKTDGLDDLEFLHILVRLIFVEFKDHKSGLDLLMSKLYWNFVRDDFDGVWNCLVDYYNTAAGAE